MIDLFRPFVAPEAIDLVSRTLTPDAQGRLYVGEGPRVAEFERQFTELVDAASPVLALNSCTSALELALYLCGVETGTDVITTPVTCTATTGAIVRLGGTPIWADVDPETGLIDPSDVARKITKRTKAVMAVDWAGQSCDYGALRRISGGKLPIIEDAAHHLFVPMDNRGDYVCWSFQAIKFLTCGDGGAIMVPPFLYDRARLLRWYGLDRLSSADFRCAQSITEAGWKAHMNDIAASIGLANLPHARGLVERHQANAAFYSDVLRGAPGVHLSPPGPGASWWIYCLMVDDPWSLIAHLKERDIAASPVHRRNDVHPAYWYPNGPLPGVDAFADHEVAIPVGWWITDEQRQHIANSVKEWAYARTPEKTAALV